MSVVVVVALVIAATTEARNVHQKGEAAHDYYDDIATRSFAAHFVVADVIVIVAVADSFRQKQKQKQRHQQQQEQQQPVSHPNAAQHNLELLHQSLTF